MNINDQIEAPFKLLISFNSVIEQYENLLDSQDESLAIRAKQVMTIAEENPILREGFSDPELINTYDNEISLLLKDAFSPILTKNEIKTASIPFQDFIFNSSERFKSIIETAGENFELKMQNIPEHDFYITACTAILNFRYGYNLNFKRPLYYKIPDGKGVLRTYKILYNADFTEIIKSENAPEITEADYYELLDNFENIELWKQKFPPESYVFKGFVISNIFDVTDDQSISNIKATLIRQDKRKDESFMNDFHEIFRSLLNVKDLEVGFSIYNKEEDTFERVYGAGMSSYLLDDLDVKECADALCEWSYDKLLKQNQYISISDVEASTKQNKSCAPHVKILHKQGIKSAIFAPIANDDELMGILELVSHKPRVLNSIVANKLVDVLPFIVSAVERSKDEEQNLVKAIIQKECTAIHDSVLWRFESEARRFIKNEMNGKEAVFNKISFNNVYPLYGQIDIQGSSDARNEATKLDLLQQLDLAKGILELALEKEPLPIYEQFLFQIEDYSKHLKTNFQVDSEQKIINFFNQDINPLLDHFKNDELIASAVDNYYLHINRSMNEVYEHRKDFDDTISSINKKMAALLDEKQIQAQAMYPHFFERYKTDGVEHNMYIGEAITREDSFNDIYLYNLRLWQLQVMCEMENAYYLMRHKLPVALDVASMILVFNRPLSISFRMDEKQFDVDGTYNARYEIVKKRVDKAKIKGTDERITQKGKLTIVYSHKQDEQEYLRYIGFLQNKQMLDTDVEIVELEDLQAVTGLKAIRVSILYSKDKKDEEFYTYEDLMTEISS
ncbi:GAF domain-containing protein [Hanstruepera ponticola]|uniref:GAF domain-containing protein n=1 Tax=Hanstruepera ponticola TaxID=2042995 RepID=UPI0017827045|nr:GAF domain-containing protein [Hanstruepera ponticola]